MLFEDQERSGNILEALQAASEGCGAGFTVALATENATELSGQPCDVTQIGWQRRQGLSGMFKGQ